MSLNACVCVSGIVCVSVEGGGDLCLFVCVCERNLRSLRLLTDYRSWMSRVCQCRSAMTGWKSASNGVSMDDINHLHETPVTFPLLAINQPYTEWDDGLKLSYPLSSVCLYICHFLSSDWCLLIILELSFLLISLFQSFCLDFHLCSLLSIFFLANQHRFYFHIWTHGQIDGDW